MIARMFTVIKTSWIVLAIVLMMLAAGFSLYCAHTAPDIAVAKLRFACFAVIPLALSTLLVLATGSSVLTPSLAVLIPLPPKVAGMMSEATKIVRRMYGKPLVVLIALNAVAVSGVLLLISVACGMRLDELLQRLFAPVLAFTTIGPLVPASAATPDAAWPGLPAIYLTLLLLSTLLGAVLARRSSSIVTSAGALWAPLEADVREIRKLARSATVSGAAGGLVGGAFAGIVEAAWCYHFLLQHATELRIFVWAPLAYGILFAPLGAIAGFGVAFLQLCRADRQLPISAWGTGAGFVITSAFIVIGRFRLAREILAQHALPIGIVVTLLAGGVLLFVGLERLGNWLERRRTKSRTLMSIDICLSLFVVAAILSTILSHTEVRQELSDVEAVGPRPNVVLIVADSMRADVLGAYNPDTLANTPNLDRLAEDGVRFDMGFAQAPWTKPSFATMFTGLYPGDHDAESKASVLRESINTLPEQLAEAGYRTVGFANNRNLLPEYRLNQGFTEYNYLMPHLYFAGSLSVEQLSLYQVLRRLVIAWKGFQVDIAHFYQPAEVVTDEVARWLDNDTSETPYFLFVHYMDSHDPYMRHDGSGIGYTSALIGENPDAGIWKSKFEVAYAAEASYLDAHVGRLLARLDDAIVILTSDHGEEFHEHGGWFHGPTVYEEVLRVPFIIRFPGGRHGGQVSSQMARHIDILPTVLRWANLAPVDPVPGRALFTESGDLTDEPADYSYAETDFLGNIGYGLRGHGHKLIEANPGNPSGMPTRGFYEMVPGEFEQRDISGKGVPMEGVLSEVLHGIRSAVGEM